MSPSHNAHHWLGMGICICPSAYENNLCFNYFFNHEPNKTTAIAKQQQQPKEWKVLLIQDKSKRISTILEVQFLGIIYDERRKEASAGSLLLHPCVAECLLYLQSILPFSPSDSIDNDNTDKDHALVNCIPFYISEPSPAVTMLPLTSLSDFSDCNQTRSSNHTYGDSVWFAEEIESIFCPHPSLVIQSDNDMHCMSAKDANHLRNYHYSTKLSIILCYCSSDICINQSLSTTSMLIQSIKQALVHRLLTTGMILLLPIPHSCWERISCNSMSSNDTTSQIVSQPYAEESHVYNDDEDEILHFMVHHVGPTEESGEDRKKCYRIGPVKTFEVQLLPLQEANGEEKGAKIQTTTHILHKQEETDTLDPICPGYNSLLQNLIQLATLPFGKDTKIPQVILSSTSPVLLSGCSGVGKTRLVSSLITAIASLSSKQQIPIPFQSHVISMKDLLTIHNSYTSFLHHKDMLLDYILPTSLLQSVRYSSNWTILILEDIDFILGPEHEMDSDDHYEATDDVSNAIHALIGNALSKAIKLLVQQNAKDVSYTGYPHQNRSMIPSPLILGISRVPLSQLPKELRLFEKEIVMPPPNLSQRKAILKFWLRQLPVDDDEGNNDGIMSRTAVVVERWAKALSPPLAGCVASDIRRICADAFITAMSRCTTILINGDHESRDTNLLNSPHVKVKWPDILEAVRNCIPSPLVALDVTPPYIHLGEGDGSGVSNEVNIRQRYEQCWSSFGGYSGVKDRLYRTVVGPWRRHLSGDGDLMGITPPTGVIFYGPSGVGKTFAAECLASSLGLNVIKIRASDVLNRWLGGSEATIRSIFARARSAAPCILFFDDLDALASTREEGQDDDAVVSRILSTFLNEIDGVTRNNNNNYDRAITSDMLIISATNRLESIDAALLRPGRLEEHVYLPIPPTPLDCKEIFQIHSRNFPLGPDVDLDLMGTLLHSTGVATGATIEGLCREVCLNVLRQNGDKGKHHDDIIEVALADFQSVLKDW